MIPGAQISTMRSLGANRRVLIADAHQIVREGVAAMLMRSFDEPEVVQATTGDQAITAWREAMPALGYVNVNGDSPAPVRNTRLEANTTSPSTCA